MNNVKIKRELIESKIAELEGQLEVLDDKERRRNFKRNRKQFRKKMVKDPAFRLMAKMNRQMFESSLPQRGEMIGLLAQVS